MPGTKTTALDLSVKNSQHTITLNGQLVAFESGETIWQIAKRLGVEIPHLCYLPKPDYRADGNCRACMVEVKGERVLTASCIRAAVPNMVVETASARAKKARSLVFELLSSDQPIDDNNQHRNPRAQFANMLAQHDLSNVSRFPKNSKHANIDKDLSHPAMAVQLDACIQCGLCVRACREIQVNDVIGMAYRGFDTAIVFDQHDPMGLSTCVACGECVEVCPTGALMPKTEVFLPNEILENTISYNSENKHLGDFKALELKKTNSGCPFCGVGCQTTIHTAYRNSPVTDNSVKSNLADGSTKPQDYIVKVTGRHGPANRNRLCVKGRFGMDYARHTDRLTEPLIRLPNKPKAWDDEITKENLYDYFRPASWDEALDLAAKRFLAIKNQSGGSAFAGFGSAKCSNEEAYLFQKFIRTGFNTNNVDHCTRLCHASSVAALMEGIASGAVSAPFTDALAADVIIVIGARPTENHPVAATYFKQAAKMGKKLIVMDPRKSGLSRHAWRHLQFKGGTDVALLSAMLHTIIDEDLVNYEYIKQHVDGFDELKAKVKDFSPEKMAKICGIEAEVIRQVAREFAMAKKSIIFWGMGISQHVHGTDNARCLIALAGITGHIGKVGTGLHPLRGQNNVQGASDAGLIPMFYPDYKSVENPAVVEFYQNFWTANLAGVELDKKRGLTVVEILKQILAGQIKAMYILGENPAMSDPDTKHARQALASLDFLLAQEIFLTETCYFADVILPASAYPEKLGSFTNSNRQVQLARPALELIGNARQDWQIICQLAEAMGLSEQGQWQYDSIAEVYEEMRQTMPSIKGISWQRLEREGAVTYPASDENTEGKAVIFGDGFPTKNGRMKLVPVDLLPPDELPDKDYPMILTTGRLLEHWHTGAMTRRAEVLDGLEWVAVAHMHPKDMAAKNYEQGEVITLSTRRGSITLPVRADRDVAVGMVFVPFCFAEAPANMLTNPVLDPYGKIPEFKFCAVRVQKSNRPSHPNLPMAMNL